MKLTGLFSDRSTAYVNTNEIVAHQAKAVMDEAENQIGGIDRQMRMAVSKLAMLKGLAEGETGDRYELAVELLTAICEDALHSLDQLCKDKNK